MRVFPRPVRELLACVCLCAAAVMPASRVAGQETPAVDQQTLKDLLERLEKVEGELARIKRQQGQNANAGGAPAPGRERKLHTMIETPYLGVSYYGNNNGARFLAMRILFINLTAEPVAIARSEFRLDVDGAQFPLVDVPEVMRNQSFQVGNQTFSLRNLKTPEEIKVPAGGTGACWMTFTNLPGGGSVPNLKLKFSAGGQAVEIDINEYAMGMLGLTVERIGPRSSLALLTISGAMNVINLGGMFDILDELTTEKVARVVIRWADSAEVPDGQILSWLAQSAYQAGRGQEIQNNQLPAAPSAIRELHLASLPGNQGSNYRSRFSRGGGPPRVHESDRAAVAAALESAYKVLPRDELLREIKEGHPLTRAAALAIGGGRLDADKLPMILQYAEDKDVHFQEAALIALRHFGEPEAIACLMSFVKKNVEPVSNLAIESLAASRFAPAHEALLEVLKNEPPESKKRIVQLLAAHPRPIWSATIYEFLQDPTSEIAIDALRALVKIGHPQLFEVLKRSLHDGAKPLQEEAFKVLVSRGDPASTELAMQYTLKFLEKSPPQSAPMQQLLNETKDRRAIPLLLAHFKKSSNNRSTIINLLGQIGDESVADALVAEYKSLQNYEKATVLNLLRQFRSPEFRRLAGEALMTTDSSLVSTASQGLVTDASPEAVKLLADALDKTTYSSGWSYISNALGTLGTVEARAALRKARSSGIPNKASYANNALRNMQQRSPGYQYIYQAQQLDRQKKWKDAETQYGMALELDSQLPDAYAGRANARLKQNKIKEAKADYEKALELDPFNGVAVTGMGIAKVLDGDVDGAVQLVEEARSRFKNDQLYAYNLACVYGRAHEALLKDEQAEDRERKLASYRQKALSELKRSRELGFNDLNWMKSDPDLKTLQDDEEFQKIVSGATVKPATPNGLPEGR